MARAGSASCRPRSCSIRVGGATNGSSPHAAYVALRRSAKHAAVLAAELRGAFITHKPAGATRVEVLVQHQLPCFLQTQLLLVLQRAQASEGAEMLPEGGWAHVRAIRQVVPVQRLHEILLEPGDGLRNLLARGPGGDEVPELRAVRTCQQADGDFLLDQRRQS